MVELLYYRSKTSYPSSLAYQAKTWKFGDVSRKLSGSDLNFILANFQSRKVLKHLPTSITKSISKFMCAFGLNLSRKICYVEIFYLILFRDSPKNPRLRPGAPKESSHPGDYEFGLDEADLL